MNSVLDAAGVLVQLLPYNDRLELRDLQQIQWVVVHCTELPDLSAAREFGLKIHYPESGTGNSGHFYVDRDGSVRQYVSLQRVAHHVSGFNRRSVGIELVNRGRYPNWWDSSSQHMTEPYPPVQIEGLLGLLDTLCRQLPGLRHIIGHEDLDLRLVPASNCPDRQVRRKLDPGPMFPWDQVLRRTSLQRTIPTGFCGSNAPEM